MLGLVLFYITLQSGLQREPLVGKPQQKSKPIVRGKQIKPISKTSASQGGSQESQGSIKQPPDWFASFLKTPKGKNYRGT